MSDSQSQITDLLYTYGLLIDSGDFDAVGRHFAHAKILNDRNDHAVEGAENIAAMYRRTTRIYPETGTPRTRHVFTNPIVSVDEAAGTATLTAIFTVYQQTESFPLQPIIIGHYDDTFERVDGVWRYASKKMNTDLVGDLSAHLLMDLKSAADPV